jgi:hypothetical protein
MRWQNLFVVPEGNRIAWPRTEPSAFDDLNRFVLAGPRQYEVREQ